MGNVVKIWDSPEIWSIRVDIPDSPLRNLNAYVLCSDEEYLMIDTGFRTPECRAALWTGIYELGLDLSRTSLFLTHLHADHTGLVEDFVAAGCSVYMSKIDYDFFHRIREAANAAASDELLCREGFPVEELPRQVYGDQEENYGPANEFPVITVENRTNLRVGTTELVCILTPGHTPGHMALYLPESQIFFSGDHVLFDITPNISLWPGVPNPLADYLDSLEKIRMLPVSRTLPAHRSVHGDLKTRIQFLKNHHQERLEEILQAVKACPDVTAYTVASRIHWSARGLGWSAFPPHQKWFAVNETLAHLYYLAEKGRIVRNSQNKIITYRISSTQSTAPHDMEQTA